MTQKQRILQKIGAMPNVMTDQPFHDGNTVARHADSGKWFGVFLTVAACRIGRIGDDAVDILDLKCDPVLAPLLRNRYTAVFPAYHMNKEHWISVVLSGEVYDAELFSWVEQSFRLTRRKTDGSAEISKK